MSPSKEFIATPKVAELFDVTTETIRHWIDKGLLHAEKIDGRWYVTRESVIERGKLRHG